MKHDLDITVNGRPLVTARRDPLGFALFTLFNLVIWPLIAWAGARMK